MSESVSNYEEVDVYPLDDDVREELLLSQNECSFVWSTRDHWPVGVIMSYVWRRGKFWLTATSQRARIRAIRRDPRVCLIFTSAGTHLGPARSITVKGRLEIHTDQETKDWFYPDLAMAITRNEVMAKTFAKMLDSERRVVLEVTPEKWITYDSRKMMAASREHYE